MTRVLRPEAVLLVGIQATGKSTFVRERLYDTHVRINLDMVRTRNRERLLLEACLEGAQSFVVDNTNVSREQRARYIEAARASDFRIVGFYFQSAIDAALERNARRPEGDRVPEAGVRGTHARLELPSMDEGFDELHYVAQQRGGFRVEAWGDEV
ncbi:MAG: AAA family ATPase [Acidobacteriota bacterium]